MFTNKKVYLVMFFLLFSSILQAENTNNKTLDYYQYKEKKDFVIKDDKDYQVLFFFSYSCPSCNYFKVFEPTMKEYFEEREDVSYYQIPVQFFKSWQETAKIHFYLKNNNLEKESNLVYEHIHKKGKTIKNEEEAKSFIQNNFKTNTKNLFNDAKIKKQLNGAIEIENYFNIDATPSIVVINKNKEAFLIKPSLSEDFKMMIVTAILLTKENSNL